MIIQVNGRSTSVRTPHELKVMIEQSVGSLSDEERAVFEIMIAEFEKGDSTLYDMMTQVEYKHDVVDMETFLTDPYYFGSAGESLYPKLKDDLIELFGDAYHEAIFSGSIGWGKTFTSCIALGRVIYELSCMRNPQRAFGLSHGATISLVQTSVNEKLARKVVFETLGTMIAQSPYFQHNFKPDKTMDEMRFPNSIWLAPSSSSDTSVLGLNIISAILDETNFLGSLSKEQKASHARWGHVDNAEILYSGVIRRMKSRYLRQGKLPGILLLVSSKKTASDFTERRIREAADDPNVFVREYSLWDVKPKAFFMDTTFKVVVGNETIKSKVLEDPAEIKKYDAHPEILVIDVPDDFKTDFDRDLEGAIRDIAGIATVAIYPYIRDREKIERCVDEGRKHVCNDDIYDMGDPQPFKWHDLTVQTKEGDWVPRYHPGKPRHVHIDTSIKNDATGIAIGTVLGYKEMVRKTMDGDVHVEQLPMIWYDMLLKIVAPPGGEIILADVRKLIYEFAGHGFQIGLITMDSYQSFDSRQTFIRQGFNCEIVSVDTKLEPYETLKDAIYDERVSYYRYAPFLEEVRRVEMHTTKRKVDHPPDGSKDVSDAAAAVAYTLTTRYKGELLNPFMGRMKTEETGESYKDLGLSGIPMKTAKDHIFNDDTEWSDF